MSNVNTNTTPVWLDALLFQEGYVRTVTQNFSLSRSPHQTVEFDSRAGAFQINVPQDVQTDDSLGFVDIGGLAGTNAVTVTSPIPIQNPTTGSISAFSFSIGTNWAVIYWLAVEDPTLGRYLKAVSVYPVGGGGSANAVTFGGANGDGPPANIGGNRPVDQSPIDVTKVGIVNLSSTTASGSVGVQANFGAILGGDQNTIPTGGNYSFIGGGLLNQVSDQYSVIGGGQSNSISPGGAFSCIGGGVSNSVSGSRATISGGQGNVVTGNYGAVPGGQGCNVGGDSAFAACNSCIANGNNSVAAGFGCVTQGGANNSTALGYLATTHAFGELAHSSVTNKFQWGHLVYGVTGASGATPATLVDGASGEWSPVAGGSTGTYRVTVRAVSDSSAVTPSSFERAVTCRVSGGVLTILDQHTIYDYSPHGETFVISAAGGTLHLVFTGVTGLYNVAAELDWVQALT